MTQIPVSERMALDFDGWAASLPDEDKERVNGYIESIPEGERQFEKDRLAAQYAVAESQGIDIAEVDRDWDMVRDGFALTKGGDWASTVNNEQAFVARVKSEVQFRKNERHLLFGPDDDTAPDAAERRELSLVSRARDAAFAGVPFVDAFTQWQGDSVVNNGWRADRTDTHLQVGQSVYEQTAAMVKKVKPIAEDALAKMEAYRKKGTGSLPSIEPFRALTPEERRTAMRLMTSDVKGQPDKSKLQAFGEAAWRGFENLILKSDAVKFRNALLSTQFKEGQSVTEDSPESEIAMNLQEANAAQLSGPQGGFMGVKRSKYRTLTAEEAARWNASLPTLVDDVDIAEELRKFSQEVVDPAKGGGWAFQKFVLPVADSMALIGSLLVPGATLPAMEMNMRSYQQDEYTRLRNLGMDAREANKIAAVTGAAQSLLDKAGFEVLRGVPAVKRLLDKVALGSGWAKRFVLNSASTTVAETAIELTQDHIIPALAQDLMTQDPNFDVNWVDVWKETAAAIPETMAGMLLISAGGGAFQTVRDSKATQKLANSKPAMLLAGYTEAQIDLIQQQPAAERGALLAQFIPQAAPTGAEKDALVEKIVNAAKAERAEYIAKLKAEIGDTSDALDYAVRVTRRQGTGWTVTTESGKELVVDSAEAARRIRQDLSQAASQREADTLVELVEKWHNADENAQRETAFTGEVAVSDGTKVTYVRDGKITREITDEAALETLRKEAEIVAQQTGSEAIQVVVNGSNNTFRRKVADAASQVVQRLEINRSASSVLTFLHESMESNWRAGMQSGAIDMESTRAAVASIAGAFDVNSSNAEDAAFAARVQRVADGTASVDEIRETVSELAVADVIGRRKDGSVVAVGGISRAISDAIQRVADESSVKGLTKLQGFIRAAKTFFRGVFGTVNAIRKAKMQNGKLAEDWESFMHKITGTSMQTDYDAARVEDLNALSDEYIPPTPEQEAAGMAFSLSPAHAEIVGMINDGRTMVVETSGLEGGKVRTIAHRFQSMYSSDDIIDWNKHWRGSKRKFAAGQEARFLDSVARASERVLEIMRAASRMFPSFQSWYEKRIKMALDIFAELDPEVKKPENNFVLRVLLAVTSNGNKVKEQTEDTWVAYQHWKQTGKMGGTTVRGTRTTDIKKSLDRVDALVEDFGWAKVDTFLSRTGTVAELRAALVDEFGFTTKEAVKITDGELIDEQVPFALIFGAKLGSFYNNLSGNFDTTTMDRWFMRTFGRAMGTQLEKVSRKDVAEKRERFSAALDAVKRDPLSVAILERAGLRKNAGVNRDSIVALSSFFEKAKNREGLTPQQNELRKAANAAWKIDDGFILVEAPANGGHRRFIRLVMNQAREVFAQETGKDWNAAELQAILWYYEKTIHHIHGSLQEDESPDYGSAANDVYKGITGKDAVSFERSDVVGGRGQQGAGVGVVDGSQKGKKTGSGGVGRTFSVSPATAISRGEFEDLAQRAWNASVKNYYDDPSSTTDPKTWRQWVEMSSAREIGLVIDSDYELNTRYNRYVGDTEDFTVEDVAEAYKNGLLTDVVSRTKNATPAIAMGEKPFRFTGQIGEPAGRTKIGDDDIKGLWEIATQRSGGKNQTAISEARKRLLLQAHVQDIAGVVGKSQAELTKALRSWSNYPAKAIEASTRLNSGVPDVSQWAGIENSAYITKAGVSPMDVDRMVESVDAPDKAWGTPDGKTLRTYIVRAFLAIDTRISWKDLKVRVLSTLQPRGEYKSSEKLITIRESSANTVAHELGHYLDHKWALESGVDQFLSDSSINEEIAAGKTSPERVQWNRRFKEFVQDLSDRSETRSEYYQSRKEVFARFVDRFVRWTEETAGVKSWGEDRYINDRFNTGDFTRFVKLLQEKAFVDANDGNPLSQGGSTTFSVSQMQASDAQYLDAVRREDMVAAQRMVDEAAKAAGYNVGPVWHGSGRKFTVFNTGRERHTFFSDKMEIAQDYAKERAQRSGSAKSVYGVFLKAQNPMVVDANGEMWDSIAAQSIENNDIAVRDLEKRGVKRITTERASEIAVKSGFDGVVIKNVRDGFGYKSAGKSTVTAVFDSSQIKSADPVTYDDAGNVIPLSQRFNEASNDIRFSLSPSAHVELLQRQVDEHLKRDPVRRRRLAKAASDKLQALQFAWETDRVSSSGAKTRALVEQRSPASLNKEQAFREAARRDELESVVYGKYGEVLENQSLSQLWGAGPVMEYLSKPGDRLHGRLMSRSAALKSGRFSETDGDYDGADGIPRVVFGGGLMPDQVAQELYEQGMLKEPTSDALWDAIRGELKSAARWKTFLENAKAELKQAKRQAYEEAAEWRREQDELQKEDWNPKARLLRDMRALDAVISVLPPELRGKVGGFIKLAELTTDKARMQEIERRMKKLGGIVEEHLKKEGVETIDDLLERAQPDTGPGEKPKGKITVEGHRVFAMVNTVRSMTEEEVDAMRARLDTEIEAKTMKGEDVLDLLEQQQVLDMFGNLDGKNAAEIDAAATWLDRVYRTGRNAWRMLEEVRLAELADLKEQTVEAIGKATKAGTQEQKKNATKLKTFMESAAFELVSFTQVLEGILGEGHPLAKRWSRAAREATNQRTDAILAANARLEQAAKRAFGGVSKLEMSRRLWDMANDFRITLPVLEGASSVKVDVPIEKVRQFEDGSVNPADLGYTKEEAKDLIDQLNALPSDSRKKNLVLERITPGTVSPAEYTEAQVLALTMLAKQEQYLPNLRKHGYSEEVINAAEESLSDAAKEIRAHLLKEYADGYAPLANVFRDMFGIDLPSVANYSPAAFMHAGESRDIDPFGGMLAEGGFRSGFLKSRKEHLAAPVINNALQVFYGHVAQTEHWRAFAPLVRELKSVFGSVEVKAAIESQRGAGVLKAAQSWVTAFEQNGFELKRLMDYPFMRYVTGRQATLTLAWKAGTLIKQSMAAISTAARLPAGVWLRGLSRVLSGKVDVAAIRNSSMIQRRIESGFSPEVRAAMVAMFNHKPSRWSQFVQSGMEKIAQVDAYFTSIGVAIAYDYHYNEGINAGLSEEAAIENALVEAEDIMGRTAQPTEMMDRSLRELKMTVEGKIMFMFASNQRKDTGLIISAWMQYKRGNITAAQFAQTLTIAWLATGFGSALLGAAWRDANDDDDDEWLDWDHWSPLDISRQALLGPLGGIPLLNMAYNTFLGYGPNDPFKPISQAKNAVAKLDDGDKAEPVEKTVRRVVDVMNGAAILVPKLEAVGVAGNIVEQVFNVADNFVGDTESETDKKDRAQRAKEKREAKNE